MTLPIKDPILTPAPQEYDRRVFSSWATAFAQFFKSLNNGGPITASTLKLTSIPTSAAGLDSGEIWHDTIDNTLKIVP